mmetsp:Transcript_76794/g.212187  ORF Transcript_76794/g.212187 Transcript_76794/m.212187 type:complete len:279 (+) Transcript_76794:733-1569(+)
MASVSHQRHRAIRPRLEERWRPIVERTVLNALRRRCLDEVADLLRPVQEAAPHILLLALRGDRKLCALRHAAERVPLDAAPTYVGADEVLLGPHVDLVAHVEVVLRLEHRFASKHSVAAVGAPGAWTLFRLAPHLRTCGRPNPISTNENVTLNLTAILAAHSDTGIVGQDFVASNPLRILYRSIREGAEKDLLQIGTVNNTSVRQAKHVSGRCHCVERAEPLCAKSIHKTILPTTGESKSVHEIVEQRLVNIPDHRERIRGKLDRSTETGKRACLLQD